MTIPMTFGGSVDLDFSKAIVPVDHKVTAQCAFEFSMRMLIFLCHINNTLL